MNASRAIPKFDSATAILRALSRYLHGKDMGMASPLQMVTAGLNPFPRKIREVAYAWGGWSEAVAPRKIHLLHAEDISRWVIQQYPRRPYQAAMIGSSNGASLHLCAALGIPWLPQTVLVGMRQQRLDPDASSYDLEIARKEAEELLTTNPELQLHHMHDGNQDRLMVQHMSYFRLKRLALGATYEQFLLDTLAPGSTLFLLECQQTWPVTRLGEHYFFQHGGLGDATPQEFLYGSLRVAHFLTEHGAEKPGWNPPVPDAEAPEAEWGFEPGLRIDVERFAQEHGYRICRIVFPAPEDLSPLVADLYRWWYQERHYHPSRLLAETFVLFEPYWTLRTGSIPFWLLFNVEESAARLERYLNETPSFNEIYLTLISNGIEAIGWAPPERWEALLSKARKRGAFLGADTQRYPRDFATMLLYQKAIEKIPSRYPLPGPLSLQQLERFLQQSKRDYSVQWLAETTTRLRQSSYNE